MSVKIKIVGKDRQGWSIDKDHFYNESALNELNFTLVKCMFNANIIYSVWYSYLLKLKFLPLRIFKGKRKIVITLTNDPEDNNENLDKYKEFVDYWICANYKQKKYLLKQNIKEKQIFINPFYVDEWVFTELELTKKEIALALNINFELIKDKFIIGSFQRDSRGDDLTKSKWHKNPEMIIEILKKTDKNKFVLLLAGPRRHFIINQCRKHKIPYVFIGNEKFIDENKDDVLKNNLSQEKINLLYNLVDLYLVTSVSEGGPKAIIEASLTKTVILSTPAGFAPDLLDNYLICRDGNEFLNKMNKFIIDAGFLKETIQKNYDKVSGINNFEAYKYRIKHIIETISNDR